LQLSRNAPTCIRRRLRNNGDMTIPGRVQNGVVIPEGDAALPEGATVSISYPAPNGSTVGGAKKRIDVPLVRTGRPGTVALTGERIAQILGDDDVSPRR
jgi:hypothetical protein